jgi:5S rRNA maturation endonuclease (ribonuclease M5)/energy-coupling factor transporter ATP-binding protein EcfA2
VLRSSQVFVTEGEKDAETLLAIGLTATTNCGGSSAWLEAYGDTLKGKDVIIVPDNDAAGEKLFNNIVASVKELANSVKRLSVPSEFKDVTDWMSSIPEDERKGLIDGILLTAPHVIDPLPLYTPKEMEEMYRDFVIQLPKKSYSLARFAPKFNKISKQLMPGELVMIMGDTGAGKTAVMQKIAKTAMPLPTLFFELELPIELMFQRQVQMEMGCYEEEVITDYQNSKESYTEKWEGMQHILTCPQSGITMDTIEKYIHRSELKFGQHPVIVLIDYMGLVRKERAKSRYEAMAAAAEQAKVIAKQTNTIVFMGSQVARPTDGNKGMLKEIQLHHAKGAGELENSANLVIGLTRPEQSKLKMHVLKNTRGPVGDVIDFDFDGAKMQITEAVNI